MNKYILLVLLVLVSGCVGGRAFIQDANNGIKITSFEANPKEAEFFDQVYFDVTFENVGGTTANAVKIELLGPAGSWRKSKAVDDILNAKTEKTGLTLKPPIRSENRPGDLQLFSASLYPPYVPKGSENVFPVKARVTYEYATTGTLVIPLITKSLLNMKKEKGESVDGSVKVTNTFAPLQIALRSGPEPLVVDDVIYSNLPSAATQFQDATYIIEFVNRGDGLLLDFTGGASAGTEGRIVSGTINIFGAGVKFSGEAKSCIGRRESDTSIKFDTYDVDLTKLRSDGSFPIPCKIKIDRSQFTATQSSTITITVEMRYDYFVEQTREVKVKGIEYDIDVLRKAVAYTPTATPIPTATPVPTSTLVPTPAPQTTPTQISTPKLTPAATQAAAPTVAAPSSLKRVFVTSTSYNGAEIGGLSGGDDKCKALAIAAGLGDKWKAWLSTSAVNAKYRIVDTQYRLVDGVTVVTNNKAELTDGAIDNPINKDEKGSTISYTNVWTGTLTDGTAGMHCNSWTSSSDTVIGGMGIAGTIGYKWTYSSGFPCSNRFSLYCFEV